MALYRPPIRPQPRFSRTNVGPMGDTLKNWSHAGDITDTKAEQHVNTTNIPVFSAVQLRAKTDFGVLTAIIRTARN